MVMYCKLHFKTIENMRRTVILNVGGIAPLEAILKGKGGDFTCTPIRPAKLFSSGRKDISSIMKS